MHILPGESTNMYKYGHEMAGKRMKTGSSGLDEYAVMANHFYMLVAVCLGRGFSL